MRRKAQALVGASFCLRSEIPSCPQMNVDGRYKHRKVVAEELRSDRKDGDERSDDRVLHESGQS
jgi:hypothetical protein